MAMRQQKWSKTALECVQERKKDASSVAKYKTRCLSTPTLFQQAGVMQGLAFILSRDETARAFADDLARAYHNDDGKKLLHTAQTAGLGAYMALTEDLIAVATWFRRFAQSELAGIKADES